MKTKVRVKSHAYFMGKFPALKEGANVIRTQVFPNSKIPIREALFLRAMLAYAGRVIYVELVSDPPYEYRMITERGGEGFMWIPDWVHRIWRNTEGHIVNAGEL